jgi:hypothetical protein
MGSGDVLYCTPALAFYKAFVVPRQYHKTMPQIDWNAGSDALVKQLRRIRSATVRRILERELWSYHQVYVSQGKHAQARQLAEVHSRAYPRSPTSDLDAYTFSGVQYLPPARAEIELSEPELERLAGAYHMVEAPPGIDLSDLPAEFELQVKAGQLVGLAESGCVSLVARTPTRFAVPENPGLILEFGLNGDLAERLTLRAGPISVVYEP